MGLQIGRARNVLDMPEHLWQAVTLARSLRLQNEKDRQAQAAGGAVPIRVWNEDAVDLEE